VLTAAAVFILAVNGTGAEVKFLREPHVSNEGQIAFAYHGNIWVANRDGADPRRLTDPVANDSRPRFSSDVQWIAFDGNRMGNGDVWLIPAAGGTAKQITFHSTDYSAHYWTPDGKHVVFTSSRDGGTIQLF